METVTIDQTLIKKIIKEDPELFRIIIEKYKKLVSHIVFRMVNNQTDRDELGQEIFIKIYKSLPSFRFKSNMATWITKIAYNTCLNYMRKKKIPLYEDQIKTRQSGAEESAISPGKIETASLQTDLQDNRVIKEEMSHFLNREIDNLPVQYRKIITFFHLDRQSLKEIGEIMNLPEGTVKSCLFRARKILKDRLLKKYNPEELCL